MTVKTVNSDFVAKQGNAIVNPPITEDDGTIVFRLSEEDVAGIPIICYFFYLVSFALFAYNVVDDIHGNGM